MGSGILNKVDLSKDIENIKFYSSEENKSLLNIYSALEELCDGYSSTNKTSIMNNIEKNKENVEKILAKRNEYVKVLNNAIVTYEQTAAQVVNMFKVE